MKLMSLILSLFVAMSFSLPAHVHAQSEITPEENFDNDEMPDELRDSAAAPQEAPTLDTPEPAPSPETAAQPIEQTAPGPVKKAQKPTHKQAKKEKTGKKTQAKKGKGAKVAKKDKANKKSKAVNKKDKKKSKKNKA